MNRKSQIWKSQIRKSQIRKPRDRNVQRRLRTLLDAAETQFGARCLRNIRPQPTPASMRVVARQLKTYGNLAAWRLGAEIEAELARAA
jgi:hypothetical protein